MKKYEILFDVPDWRIGKRNGHKIYPIRALKDFGNIKAGMLGGRIENEDNLSQEGDAWVGEYGEVYENARVYDNALVRNAAVYGNAKIYGDAFVDTCSSDADAFVEICGDVEVYGDAHIKYNTKLSGNAKISGNALIKGSEDHICIQGLNRENAAITAFRDAKREIAVQTNKFFGSLSEFKESVKEIYGNREDAKFLRERMHLEREYMAIINLIEIHFTRFYHNALEPFAGQLKAARKAAGLSQVAMAAALHISKYNIARWETNQHTPPEWAAELLLEKLHNMITIETDLTKSYYNTSEPFAGQLKTARKAAGFNQAAMADALRIPKRNIENWESGANEPPFWAAELLLEKLNNIKIK